MERGKHTLTLLLAGALCLALAALTPASAVAGNCSRPPEPDAAELDYGRDNIVYMPLDEFETMTLSVTGPFEYTFEQTVGTGENAVFELSQDTIDGCYTWEIRIDPILSQEILDVLAAARESGDFSEVRALMIEGSLPDRARVQSGSFQVIGGLIVYSEEPEPPDKKVAAESTEPADGQGDCEPGDKAAAYTKDYVINDDLIVDGSACVGFDCANGWSFNFTTIAMSEHNTRIKFDDTSSTYSYPNNDWQLEANSSANGGAERFAIIDCGDNDSQGNCSGSTVFAIEAGAGNNALYVDDSGRVGFGTSSPSVELHVVDGNTPTLRLAQDGSSGFTPQTFDVCGNESNFFIRDTTNGSKLPFRIQPGTATSTLTLKQAGVGINTWSPSADLHIYGNDGSTKAYIQDAYGTAATRTLLYLKNNGGVRFDMEDSANSVTWVFQNQVGQFEITKAGTGVRELELDGSGNLEVTGDITSGGTTYVPDYVFEPDYQLMPLAELAEFVATKKHLPGVPSQTEVTERGAVNLSRMQMQMLEKIEELTLYTIDQQQTIQSQQALIEQLMKRVEALEQTSTE
jgi:hypothetical protein